MSTAFLREHRLKQLKEDIARYKKLTQTQGIWFAIRFSWFTAISMYIVEYLFDLLVDGVPIPVYVSNYNYGRLLTTWIIWFLVDYFWLIKQNPRALKRSMIELEKHLEKYPELKKEHPDPIDVSG
jgi:hypothetical protein